MQTKYTVTIDQTTLLPGFNLAKKCPRNFLARNDL